MCISRMDRRVQNEVQAEMSDESCRSPISSNITNGFVSESQCTFSKLGLVGLSVDDEEHILLKHRFYTSIGALAHHYSVVAIYRNMYASPLGRASLESFRLFLKATKQKRNGNANVVNIWLGTSQNGIHRILNDGFGIYGMPEDGVAQCFGLSLFRAFSC